MSFSRTATDSAFDYVGGSVVRISQLRLWHVDMREQWTAAY